MADRTVTLEGVWRAKLPRELCSRTTDYHGFVNDSEPCEPVTWSPEDAPESVLEEINSLAGELTCNRSPSAGRLGRNVRGLVVLG